jgi:outer membrane immunogenic protein
MEAKMKRLLFTVGIAVASINVDAQSAFQGFYGQVGIGYESTSVKFSGGTQASVGPYNISANNSNSFTGVIGVGGYFPVTQSFLMGIGAEYNPIPSSSADYTVTLPAVPLTYSASYKKKNSYNIFLSPALVIDKNKLAYAKVGFTGLSSEQTVLGEKTTSNFTGYSLGLGYRQIIQGGLYGFIETNYATYSSKQDTNFDGATGNNKPTTMNAILGVGYKF